MHIQSIDSFNQNPAMKAGLYFTKKSNVIYNKDLNIKYATDEIVKVSKEGSRYIEDNLIPQSIKDRFAKIPFIKDLSEKFDTFIYFREIPKEHKNNSGFHNISFAQIGWADYSKGMAQKREVQGCSPISQEIATDKMFKNLESCNFCDIS